VRRDGTWPLRLSTTSPIGKNVRVRVKVKASQVAIDGEIERVVHDPFMARIEPLQNSEAPALILAASNDT